MGLGAFQAGVANARANRMEGRQAKIDDENQARLKRQDERQRRLDIESEIDREIERDRQARLEESLTLEIQAKRDEAKRLVEASDAYDKFQAGASLIDPGDPLAVDKYSKITQAYLPAILKHDQVARKWEALDRATKQGAVFTAKKVTELATLNAIQEATRIAPDLLLDPPKKADGTTDYVAVSAALRERKREMVEDAENLRRITAEGRGAPQRPAELGPGSKAELEAVADELRSVNKAILDLRASGALTSDPDEWGRGGSSARADKLRALIDQKATLQRRLRAFDTAPGSPPAGRSQPSTANATAARPIDSPVEAAAGDGEAQPVRVGDFVVRQVRPGKPAAGGGEPWMATDAGPAAPPPGPWLSTDAPPVAADIRGAVRSPGSRVAPEGSAAIQQDVQDILSRLQRRK